MANAALTANADRESKGAGRILEVPVAKEVEEFYKGALIMADSSGYAIVGADTASCKFLGIAVESKSITTEDAADGTTKIRIYTAGDFLIGHETGDAAITTIGDVMCIWNDNSVDDATKCSTGAIECGVVTRWKDADEVWVRIDTYSMGNLPLAAS